MPSSALLPPTNACDRRLRPSRRSFHSSHRSHGSHYVRSRWTPRHQDGCMVCVSIPSPSPISCHGSGFHPGILPLCHGFGSTVTGRSSSSRAVERTSPRNTSVRNGLVVFSSTFPAISGQCHVCLKGGGLEATSPHNPGTMVSNVEGNKSRTGE